MNGIPFSEVTGNVHLLGTANNINSSSGFTVTNGDLVVVNGADLTLSGAVRANNLFFEVAKPAGTLTLGAPAVVGELATPPVAATLTATAPNGRISLVADKSVVAAAASSVTTTAGTVELAPFSAIGISLPGGLVPIIHTGGGTLEVGAATDVPAGAASPAIRASSIDIAGPLNLTTDIAAILRLDSTGPITETGGPLDGLQPGGEQHGRVGDAR